MTPNGALLVGTFFSSRLSSRSVCEDLADRLASCGLPVITTSTRTNKAARLIDMIFTSWMKRRRYTVAQVDVFSGPAFVWAEAVCWVLRRASKPYVLTLHGGNLPEFSRGHAARVRRLLQSATAVTTPSRYLLERMRVFREDLRLLHNGIDLSSYPFRLRTKPNPRLIWVRAFHEIYNPSLAVEVVALLKDDFPNIQLTMIGRDKKDGSLRALARKAAQLSVANRIEIVGGVPRKDLPARFDKADIFLNTTNVDNAPVSVVEALACGLCVVSTGAGGIPFLLRDECDSLVVPPSDPTAMAAATRRLLTEPALALTLSRNARRRAGDFDWNVVLPQWQNLLGSIATSA